MQNNNETSVSIIKVEKVYDKLFKKVGKLTENEIIRRQDCKFCNHPIRADAEAEFEKRSRSFRPVLKFFRDWETKNPEAAAEVGSGSGKGRPMNDVNVRNHLLNHYAQQERRMWLVEYGERVNEMMNYKIDKDKRYEMLSSVLEMKWHEIASNPMLDSHKQIDTLCKITKAILEIDVVQARLKGDLTTINIYLEKFHDTWRHLITNATNPEVKNALITGLDSFQNMDSTIVPEIE